MCTAIPFTFPGSRSISPVCAPARILETESADPLTGGERRAHGPRRSIEHGEEPVPGGAHLRPAMFVEGSADHGVVRREQLGPGRVAEASCVLGGTDDVREQDGGEAAVIANVRSRPRAREEFLDLGDELDPIAEPVHEVATRELDDPSTADRGDEFIRDGFEVVGHRGTRPPRHERRTPDRRVRSAGIHLPMLVPDVERRPRTRGGPKVAPPAIDRRPLRRDARRPILEIGLREWRSPVPRLGENCVYPCVVVFTTHPPDAVGERVVERDRTHATGMAGCEQQCERRRGVGGEDADLVGVYGLQHGNDVVDMRLEWLARAARESIGEAHTSAVHRDHAGEGPEALVEVDHLWDPPVRVEVREEPLHQQDVDRPRPERLERDERPVRSLRVAGVGDVHVPSSRRDRDASGREHPSAGAGPRPRR